MSGVTGKQENKNFKRREKSQLQHVLTKNKIILAFKVNQDAKVGSTLLNSKE